MVQGIIIKTKMEVSIMKGKWKLCVLSGSVLVCSILGALILLNGIMSSADGTKKSFATTQGVTGTAVGEENEEQIKLEKKEYIKQQREEKIAKAEQGKETETYDTILIPGTEDYVEWLCVNIVYYAEVYEGARYVYGGTELPQVEKVKKWDKDGSGYEVVKTKLVESKTSGVDSSGFVKAIFEHFQIELPRSVKEQAEVGEEVKIKDVQEGDVIFYGSSVDMLTHCGIYIGEGKVVHASPQAKKVIVSDMNYRQIAKVKRITKE